MAIVHKEFYNVCRLCLSECPETLNPASTVIDSTLSTEDVERITGVRVFSEENVSYAICNDCHGKIQKCSEFHTLCTGNDVQFRELIEAILCYADIVEEFDDSEELVTSCADHSYCVEKKIKPPLEIKASEIEAFDSSRVRILFNMDENDFTSDNVICDDTVEEKFDSSAVQSLLLGASDSCTANEEHESTAKKKKRIQYLVKKRLCTMCGKLCRDLRIHQETHTNEKLFSCTHCTMSFKCRSYLLRHIQAVHQKKVLERCDECDRNFTHKHSYFAHMRAKHNVGAWYECKLCDLKFRHPGGLNDHNNRKHNSASNCRCPICDMKFEDSKRLKVHGRVHSTEKPFACKYCPKRFKSGHARKNHEMIHEGVEFACALCNKKYHYKSVLNQHVRSCHAASEQTE